MTTSISEKINNKKEHICEILLLLAAMTWGGEYVVAKLALDSITPLWLNTMRFGAGWCLLMIILHRNVMTIRWQHIKAGILAGLFMFGGFSTQLIAINLTTASNAAFLTTIYVVIIPLYVWIIYKKRPSSFIFIAAALSLAGAAFLSINGSFSINLGDGMAVLSAAMFAADICACEYFIKRGMNPLVMTICQMGTVAVLSCISALVFEPVPNTITPAIGFSVLYMVLGGAVFTQVAFNLAMKYTPSTKAAIINSSEAVFGFIFAVIFLGDPISFRNIIGGAFIIMAVIVAETELSFLKGILNRIEQDKLEPCAVKD